MGLANLWLPTLRGVIERNIAAVAAGQRSKEGVLAEAVAAFRADFEAAAAQVRGVGGVCSSGAHGLVGQSRAECMKQELMPALDHLSPSAQTTKSTGPYPGAEDFPNRRDTPPTHTHNNNNRPTFWSRRCLPSCLAAHQPS